MLLFVAGFSSLSVRVAVHLLTGSIQNKKQSKHGTGGLTMGIQERIDALTEAEAKAALEFFVKYTASFSWCEHCPFEISCPLQQGIANDELADNEDEVEECGLQFLTGALKEARK